MIAISALNAKTLLTVLLLGAAPLLLVAGMLVALVPQGKGSLASAAVAAGAGILLAGLGIWQLSVVRVDVSSDTLYVGGGLYRISVPMAEVVRESGRPARSV